MAEVYRFAGAAPVAQRDAGILLATSYTVASWLVLDGGADRGLVSERSLSIFAEDEPDARTILGRRLRASGWACLAHASVESALQDPELRHVEAVVADVVMKGHSLDGREGQAPKPKAGSRG
jgi:hypothetical protein